MSSPDYTSTDAKLARAKEHIQMLDAEIGVWLDSGSYTYTVERNEEHTELYFRAKSYGPAPDYLRWTLIVGDAINNLRSALDHVVYAIAKHETMHDPTPDIEGLAFLITDTPKKWLDRNNQRRVKGLSASVVATIKSFQPFNRPHPLLPPLLQVLKDFSNADKHRLLKLAATAVMGANVDFTSPNCTEQEIGISSNPIEDGDIFAAIKSPQAEPNLALQAAQFRVEIALWHRLRENAFSLLQGRTSVIPLMNMLSDETALVVRELKLAVV